MAVTSSLSGSHRPRSQNPASGSFAAVPARPHHSTHCCQVPNPLPCSGKAPQQSSAASSSAKDGPGRNWSSGWLCICFRLGSRTILCGETATHQHCCSHCCQVPSPLLSSDQAPHPWSEAARIEEGQALATAGAEGQAGIWTCVHSGLAAGRRTLHGGQGMHQQ